MENGLRIYHAGDTALYGDMKLFGDRYKPDVAMLPIGDHFTRGPMGTGPQALPSAPLPPAVPWREESERMRTADLEGLEKDWIANAREDLSRRAPAIDRDFASTPRKASDPG